MIKKIAWEAFKNTGDINTYLELKQIENIEDKIEKRELNVEKGNVEKGNVEEKNIDKQNYIIKENFEGKEEL